MPLKTQRLLVLWLVAVASLVTIAIVPVSNFLTRAGSLCLLFVVWFGLIALIWRHRLPRFLLIAVPVAGACFLALPARDPPDTATLRVDYVAGLRRYEGAAYVWGGESPLGIDCSGLVRRGLVDSLFLRGTSGTDPGLVRSAFKLWWNDCTARSLGTGEGETVTVFETPSVNELDPSALLPGDLAVTRNGVHVMAHLGDGVWIEADPEAGRVISLQVPVADNPWFEVPMRVVRWRVLRE